MSDAHTFIFCSQGISPIYILDFSSILWFYFCHREIELMLGLYYVKPRKWIQVQGHFSRCNHFEFKFLLIAIRAEVNLSNKNDSQFAIIICLFVAKFPVNWVPYWWIFVSRKFSSQILNSKWKFSNQTTG